MRKAILFDLGNTLAAYYTSAEWPAILERCIGEVQDEFAGAGCCASHQRKFGRACTRRLARLPTITCSRWKSASCASFSSTCRPVVP